LSKKLHTWAKKHFPNQCSILGGFWHNFGRFSKAFQVTLILPSQPTRMKTLLFQLRRSAGKSSGLPDGIVSNKKSLFG
jgi:hypothetical protein